MLHFMVHTICRAISQISSMQAFPICNKYSDKSMCLIRKHYNKKQTAYMGVHVPQQSKAPKFFSDKAHLPLLHNYFTARAISVQHIIKL